MASQKLTGDDLAPIVEMSEAEAWNDFFLAAPADLGAQLGLQTEYYGSTVALIASKLEKVMFNRVVGLGILEPADPTAVDAILEDYAEAHARTFAVQVSPFAHPPALPDWLRSHGLAPRGNRAIVYRSAQPPPPQAKTNLRVEMIGPADGSRFAEIACGVFDMPSELQPWLAATVNRDGWLHYMAFDSARPVACAALFVDGNVGWLGWAATLEPDRNRGAQSALMERRVNDGVAMGCDWFVSECAEETPGHPNPSYHNLLRNGFQLAYLRPNWMREDMRQERNDKSGGEK